VIAKANAVKILDFHVRMQALNGGVELPHIPADSGCNVFHGRGIDKNAGGIADFRPPGANLDL